jgi:copper homeostasis protein
LIEVARAAVNLPLHVIIRPRAGDFCYDLHEFLAMQRDIQLAKECGANGVVFGILDADANVDVARTRRLVECSRPLSVTFHRAFDMAADLFRALEEVCSAGVDRLLTSGGQPTATLGREAIAQLIKQTRGRIVIMPGSGIKPENAQSLVTATGATEIHASLRASVPSPMRYQNPRIAMGSSEADGREYARFVVREDDVRRLCQAVNPAENRGS